MRRCLECLERGFFSLMCFHWVAVEFITFTYVGVTPLARFIIENTRAVSAAQPFHFHEDSRSLQCEICSGGDPNGVR